MKLSNIKIGAKLIGAFAVVLAIATAQSLVGVHELKMINEKSTEIAENWLPSVKLTSRINTTTSDLRIAQLQHVLADNDAAMDAFEKEIAALTSTMETDRAAYVKLISSSDEQRLYDAFSADWKRYLEQWPQVHKLSRAQKTAEAQALLNGDARKAFDAASDELNKLIALNDAGAAKASKEGDDLYAHAKLVVFAALGVMIALGMTVAWVLSRELARGVGHAAEVMRRVA